MANKEITLGVGSLGIGTDITTFSLYHTEVTSSNLIQGSIPKADIVGGTAVYDVDETLFTFIVVDDVYGGRQTINLPAPTVTSFTPTSGETGDTITITGTGFAGSTAVTFGGTSATFTKNSNTSITAVVAAGSTGNVTVTNPKGTGTSSQTFTYIPPSGTPTYYLGRFGYTKAGESSLCSLVNSYPSYDLYCAGYDSLSAALAASANVYTDVTLTGIPPYGFYSLRSDSTPPTTDDIGFYYQFNLGIPVAKLICGGEVEFD